MPLLWRHDFFCFPFTSIGCIDSCMKAAVFFVLSVLSISAQDINLKNRVVSFRDLQGRAYFNVTLVRGDLDGLIWRDKKGSGGRICYTNLSADFLDTLGIPPERIAVAGDRAAQKAVADARYRAGLASQAEARRLASLKAQAELATNAVVAAQGSNQEPPYDDTVPAYPAPYGYYAPFYPYGIGFGPQAPPAPSAASAPSAMPGPMAPSSPSVQPAPTAPSHGSALSTGAMSPAPSAPSAPMSGGAPGRMQIPRTGR